MAAKLPGKLRSIRFRQRLSLGESWRVSAGEGEDAVGEQVPIKTENRSVRKRSGFPTL